MGSQIEMAYFSENPEDSARFGIGEFGEMHEAELCRGLK